MALESPPEPYSLFQHQHLAPLIHLLQPHLINALPLYSTLLPPGTDAPVWASFPPPEMGKQVTPPSLEKPFVILADLGNQLRFFCSYETEQNLSQGEDKDAEELLVGSLRWYLRNHSQGRNDIRIGAIPDMWTDAIARSFSTPFYPCNIHYQLLPGSTDSESNDPSASPTVPLREGIVAVSAEEGHTDQVLSTSDVPHLASYILTRLPYTSAFIQSPSVPFPSSAAYTSSNSSPPLSSQTKPPELIAHCITHRDGSLGTVFVNSSLRSLGIGAQLLQHRMREMAASPLPVAGDVRGAPRYAYCYVSPGNEKSKGLMRKVGMEVTGWCVSWAVVELPPREELEVAGLSLPGVCG
ncbi:hypothetical protein JCM11641_006776 [Rhodosporidiobolus odoratus]